MKTIPKEVLDQYVFALQETKHDRQTPADKNLTVVG
jgi:hypothetical protein